MSEILKEHINSNTKPPAKQVVTNLSDIVFRNMRKEDIPSVLEIERTLFKDAWNFDHFLFEINEHEYSIPMVGEYKNEIIAYVVCWAMFEEFHIANIAVDPKYQRLGIAEYLDLEVSDLFGVE